MNNARILIGTLYSGENEFDECIESVKNQTYNNVEHIFFKYLPNKEAHDTLYKTFMERADEFDYFIKLDADMVFNTDKALEIILDYFSNDPEIDHLVTVVDDRYSDTLIQGLHAFSKRARWEQNNENLFVDHNPVIPGKKKVLREFPAPLVKHCPNPSNFQAYHFGVHRVLKAFQPGRADFNGSQSQSQWKLIRNVYDHFLDTRDIRLGFCILGANHVIDGKVAHDDYSNCKTNLSEFFKQFDNMSVDELTQELEVNWANPLKKNFLYIQQIYYRMPYWYLKRGRKLANRIIGHVFKC